MRDWCVPHLLGTYPLWSKRCGVKRMGSLAYAHKRTSRQDGLGSKEQDLWDLPDRYSHESSTMTGLRAMCRPLWRRKWDFADVVGETLDMIGQHLVKVVQGSIWSTRVDIWERVELSGCQTCKLVATFIHLSDAKLDKWNFISWKCKKFWEILKVSWRYMRTLDKV